jgi:hypothetical protein
VHILPLFDRHPAPDPASLPEQFRKNAITMALAAVLKLFRPEHP